MTKLVHEHRKCLGAGRERVGAIAAALYVDFVITRLIPVIPHSVANYALGLSRLPLGAYAFGSLVGQLPMTIAYVDLGTAGERLTLGVTNWFVPTFIGVVALSLSLLIPAIARRRAC